MKKLGSVQYKENLLIHHKQPMALQKEKLIETLLKWKGDEEQVDAITVVGLKL